MILRPYQQAAIDCAWQWMRTNPGNPAIVIPTGGGKSPVMGAMARQVAEAGGLVGVLAHVKELVEQNHAKLRAIWPEARAGIYSASMRRRDRFDPILFMQVQSVAKRAPQLGRFDLLLIDEAHRVPLTGDGQYLQFIDGCRRFNPDLRVVGLTATPYRLQGAAVPVCGPDNVLTDIAYEARIGDLIADGYLSKLVSKAGRARADLSGVHTRGGEYVEAELARAVDRTELVEAACDELCALAADRRAWIVFAVTVAHAEHVADALKARGIAAGIVHGGTPKPERERIIADYQRGALRALVNVNVLSEGFDAPHIDCVAMLRPTKSPGLYYQQVGRGLRLAPGKTDCLVLDFAGNAIEHGPVDAITVSRPRKAGQTGEVKTGAAKECPQCSAVIAAGCATCPECGHEFPAREVSHFAAPVGAPILSAERVTRWHDVHAVEYDEHIGKSGVPTLQVTYVCGFIRFREWVCFEHTGQPRARAVSWWAQRHPNPRQYEGAPNTVADAAARANTLTKPARIHVSEASKYPEIVAYEFATRPDAAAEGRADPVAETRAGGAGVAAHLDPVRGMRRVLGGILQPVPRDRAA
jgi:DNA repair protein RadD